MPFDRLSTLPLLLAAALPWSAVAADNDASVATTVRQNLQSRYPDVKILAVDPAPVPGLYEVFTGDAISYSDASGNLLLVGGTLVDTRTKFNMTADSLAARNAIDFAALPLDRAIKVVKGDGRRQIAVFADPDCPFCKKLEETFASTTNVTIHTFLFPLADLHPQALAHSRMIWCATDRAAAWTNWMLEQRIPESKGECEGDPIAELATLGKQLHILSTPTVFLANGKRLGGAMTAQQLEKELAALKP